MSQFTTPSNAPERHRTLTDFIPVKNVYPVGRLDHDSEGLLLLTDDGALQHRLSNPRFGHERTYWVQVEGAVTEEALERLRSGLAIQAYRARPCRASQHPPPDIPARDPPIRVREHIPTSWIEITLTEGRNRQVRRMTAAVGLPTLRLIRVSLGELKLGSLRPGEWRDLKSEELRSLR